MHVDVQICTRRVNNTLLVWEVESLLLEARRLSHEYRPLSSFDLDKMYFFGSYEEANLNSFVYHMTRVNSVNLKDPVILSSDGHIMDGMHRLVKATILRRKRIAVVQFPVDPKPFCVHIFPEDGGSGSPIDFSSMATEVSTPRRQ